MNNNFYTNPLSPEALRRRLAMQQGGQQAGAQGAQGGLGQDTRMSSAADIGLDQTNTLSAAERMPLVAGGSLSSLVSQDGSSNFQRRRSVPHHRPFSDGLAPQGIGRRMSLMDYDTPVGGSFPGFSFGFPGDTALPGNPDQFTQSALMTLPDQTDFGTLSPDTVGMDAFANLFGGPVGTDSTSMNLFSPAGLQAQYPAGALAGTVGPDFAMDMGVEGNPMGASAVNPIAGFGVSGSAGMMGANPTQPFGNTTVVQDTPGLNSNTATSQFQPSMLCSEPREASVPAPFRSPGSAVSRAMSQSSAGPSSTASATPASTAPTAASAQRAPRVGSRDPKKDVYSKSGFDMLRALFYVATRKNPTVEIGAVDLSCAFVVCDLTLNDCPIIYVSDNFQNLTGYNRHEIVGQNCRFLQSPDGKVEAGSKREFVANDAVFKLKNAVAEGKEIQQSLINYRKGGKPFLNLLTMIPIPWDTDEFRYIIGFQIDLVECPDAISGQESGAMQVNYRHSDIGQYFWNPPSSTHWEPDSGQTLGVDEVSSLIQQHNPRGAPSEWHKQSWDKMLLENADDVIHVLSLKGLFLYLSPACKKTLEYDPSDLVGTSLSSICHPSDIVPVTRELKDAQASSAVNIAFRIRRKHSGYTWFESHGTLFCEQNKGRKYIILVGRKRPVFSLRRRDVDLHAGGIALAGDSEIWSKVSTSGMFLFVSSSAKSLLDLPPRELAGTSMQNLMKKESRAEFGRTIEKARKGAVVGLKHELLHKRGHPVAAQTVFYPGDRGLAPRGKPSFLIAQTRLVKAGRVIAAGKSGGVGAAAGLGVVGVATPVEDVMGGVVIPKPLPTTTALAATTLPYPDSATDDEGDEGDIFAELRTTRCTSWQYELRQMEKVNRLLAEELTQLMSNKKKRKRRKGGGNGFGSGGGAGPVVRDCANCHKRDTPEWRRGPSGNRDLCNSCGLRWAKQTGKVSPRNTSRANSDGGASKRTSVSTASTNSPAGRSPLRREVSADAISVGSSNVERGSIGDGSAMDMGSIREE